LVAAALVDAEVPAASATLRGSADVVKQAGASQTLLNLASDPTPEPETVAETTTLPPGVSAETPRSIIAHIIAMVNEQLHSEKHQWVNPLLAFVFGGIMVIDGEEVFKWLLVGAVFLLVSVVAMGDLGLIWPQGDFPLVRRVVGVEAGLLGAFAAIKGIQGVTVLVGAIIGASVAFSVQHKLTHFAGNVHLFQETWWVVSLYTIIIVLSVMFFLRKKHSKALAMLSAAAGGALVVSAVAWVVTEVVVKAHIGNNTLTPERGAWIDFLRLLCVSGADDEGIYANSKFNFDIHGIHFYLDRVLGCIFWFALFAVGTMTQLKNLKRQGIRGKVTLARGPLHTRLLNEE